MADGIDRTAVLSSDGIYRYACGRQWDVGDRRALFVMLNPSTADDQIDDPTIRRCMAFARREHCDGLVVVNLYAYRATDPAELWRVDDPVGPHNDNTIRYAVADAVATGSPIVAAWGALATNPHRVYRVKQIPGMERAQALGLTKSGAPRHPLYVKGDTALQPLKQVRRE